MPIEENINWHDMHFRACHADAPIRLFGMNIFVVKVMPIAFFLVAHDNIVMLYQDFLEEHDFPWFQSHAKSNICTRA